MPVVNLPKIPEWLQEQLEYPENNTQLRNYLSGIKRKMEEKLTYAGGVPPSAVPDKYLSPEAKEEAARVAKYGGIRNPRWYDPGEEGFGLNFAAPIAYHGTPYKFEKFLKEKIGAGQGAQSYGYGLYFAENEMVAKSEAYMNPHGIGRGADHRDLAKRVLDAYEGDKEGAIGELVRRKERAKSEDFNRKVDDAIQYIKSGETGKGYLYKVDIKPPAEKFLDWDKPLREQSKEVQEQVKSVFYALGRHQDPTDMTGKQIYYRISEWFRSGSPKGPLGNMKDASLKMNEFGIPGIRYLDQGSRQSGKGTYNYVVFNENDVKILERK